MVTDANHFSDMARNTRMTFNNDNNKSNNNNNNNIVQCFSNFPVDL